MHIVILPSEYFITKSDPLGGIFQYHQAKALTSRNFKVGVISVGFKSIKYLVNPYFYLRNEIIDDIIIKRCYPQLYLPGRFLGFKKRRKMYTNLGLKLITDYINEHGKPDVIHAHNFLFAGFVANEIKKKLNIPFIITEHSSSYAKGLVDNSIDDEIIKCVENASAITAVSTPFCSLLSKRFDISVTRLPNIVNEFFFLKEGIKGQGQFTFLNIAELNENKNHGLLIKSFSSCFKNKDIILKIGGDGPLLNELQGLVQSLGIEKQVNFLGRLTQLQVKHEMVNSNCFVLSSDYETFGVVLIEALACGIPVIATKCGGPEEIINDENGFLVDVGDQKALSKAMMDMIDKAISFDKLKLSNQVRYNYGEDAFVKNVLRYYQKCQKE